MKNSLSKKKAQHHIYLLVQDISQYKQRLVNSLFPISPEELFPSWVPWQFLCKRIHANSLPFLVVWKETPLNKSSKVIVKSHRLNSFIWLKKFCIFSVLPASWGCVRKHCDEHMSKFILQKQLWSSFFMNLCLFSIMFCF